MPLGPNQALILTAGSSSVELLLLQLSGSSLPLPAVLMQQ